MAANGTYKPGANGSPTPMYPGASFDVVVATNYFAAGFPEGIVVWTKTTGDVTLTTLQDASIVLTAVPAYFVIPGRYKAVSAATASCVGCG